MSTGSFQCRACNARAGQTILDLGLQPLANNLLREEDLSKPEPRFPLRVAVCETCWLLQITETVPPVDLFSEYLYFSSFSETMLHHARSASESYIRRFALGGKSLVVEVASNDGYLLKNFVAAGIPCLGIEPAANIAKVAREKGIETMVDFFGPDLASRLVREGRAADLILGNNVFAHVPDVNGFAAALSTLLKPQGVAVLEFPYGVDFVERNEFDTVYHEHVFYFTLTPLISLFRRHGLVVFDVERIPIHGGSLRIYIGRQAHWPIGPSVDQLLQEESGRGVSTLAFYRDFTARVGALRTDLVHLISALRSQGNSVAAYGASAKGSTLLNFYQLGPKHLDFVADRSTYKQGRLTPGMHLPILGPEALLEKRPPYTLLLTWNFAEEILAQQQEYRSLGGKFIIPIPKVEIV